MGEIVRLVLERLTMEGLLFRSVDTECELFERGRFFTKYVSEIERYVVSCFVLTLLCSCVSFYLRVCSFPCVRFLCVYCLVLFVL
jgi:hypothetical protein